VFLYAACCLNKEKKTLDGLKNQAYIIVFNWLGQCFDAVGWAAGRASGL